MSGFVAILVSLFGSTRVGPQKTMGGRDDHIQNAKMFPYLGVIALGLLLLSTACADMTPQERDELEAGRIGEVQVALFDDGDGTGCSSERRCFARRNPGDNVPEHCCYNVSICPCSSTPDGTENCEYPEPLECEAYYRGPGSRVSADEGPQIEDGTTAPVEPSLDFAVDQIDGDPRGLQGSCRTGRRPISDCQLIDFLK